MDLKDLRLVSVMAMAIWLKLLWINRKIKLKWRQLMVVHGNLWLGSKVEGGRILVGGG